MDAVTASLIGVIIGATGTVVVGGTRFSVLDNLVVGVIGALLGGWGFHLLFASSPSSDALAAALGAVFLISASHRVHQLGASRRARRPPMAGAPQRAQPHGVHKDPGH